MTELFDLAVSYRRIRGAHAHKFYRRDHVRSYSAELPVLCIDSISGANALCWWFNEKGEFCDHIFPLSDLYRVAFKLEHFQQEAIAWRGTTKS